jgi:PmbA protein
MNLEHIRDFLNRADGVTAWQLTRRLSEETTIIRLPGIYTVENGRFTSEPNPHPREVITTPAETVYVTIYCEHESDGHTWRGNAIGQITSDADDALKQTVDALVAGARSQKNEPFPLPGPDDRYEDVELADPEVLDLDQAVLIRKAQEFNDGIVRAAADLDQVDISNLELFIRRARVRFETSSGIELEYPATRINVEACFLARPADDKVGEHTARLAARHLAAFDPREIVTGWGAIARDIALAGPPQNWQGPVVLLGDAAADVLSLSGNPLGFHASARGVHEQTSKHSDGKPVTGDAKLKGEPFTLTSDPFLPLGLESRSLSDFDGTPTRRVVLAQDGNWAGLLGGRRYYHYLGLMEKGATPPGPRGNSVVPAGPTGVGDLLCGDCVAIRAFSDFGVDDASGEFAVEVRLGELRKDGKIIPFKGGLFVGNWFTAIADANYSKETQTYWSYYGPYAVRFNQGKIAG